MDAQGPERWRGASRAFGSSPADIESKTKLGTQESLVIDIDW